MKRSSSGVEGFPACWYPCGNRTTALRQGRGASCVCKLVRHHHLPRRTSHPRRYEAMIANLKTFAATVILSLALVSFSFGSAIVAHTPPERGLLAGITDQFNMQRASVDRSPLVWDPLIAAVAQSWTIVLQCDGSNFGHNPGADSIPNFCGEIVGIGFITLQDFMNSVVAERQYMKNDLCSELSLCGHYSIMTNANATRVGCGVNACNVWVCDFAR